MVVDPSTAVEQVRVKFSPAKEVPEGVRSNAVTTVKISSQFKSVLLSELLRTELTQTVWEGTPITSG